VNISNLIFLILNGMQRCGSFFCKVLQKKNRLLHNYVLPEQEMAYYQER